MTSGARSEANLMLKFLSSMLCTFRIHPFSLGNYLRTSLIIGNFMIINLAVTECRMDMVRAREASCLVCCLVHGRDNEFKQYRL
jgi:hypothetical protein